MKPSILFSFALLMVGNSLSAQEKLEREYSISKQQVPDKALQFVAENYAGLRVRWYREENLQGQSIEAKLKKKRQWHSIEFDTLGRLQDVEILIKYKDIAEDLREEMEGWMEEEFSSYKIDKVQRQWSGSESAMAQLIKEGKSELDFERRYEIVVKGRKGGKTDFYELLFDDDGELLEMAKIIERSVNHMIF